MSRKVLLSFLGTGNYSQCVYYKDNFESGNTKFIQEALQSYLISNNIFSTSDVILLISTEGSYAKNGVELLELLNKANNQNCSVNNIIIKDGKNEDEFWQNFTSIFNVINENDELYFDITHAFRYLPMFMFVMANYSELIKKTTLKEIFYGNFEARDTSNRAPIMSLIGLHNLTKWIDASGDFVNNGKTTKIVNLLQNSQSNRLKKNSIIGELQLLEGYFYTVRGKELMAFDSFRKLSKMEEIDPKYKDITVFKPVFNLISDKIKPFEENKFVSNGLAAVQWCIDYSLIQQGYTLLQEFIITLYTDLIIPLIKNDYKDYILNIRPELADKKSIEKECRRIVSSVLGKATQRDIINEDIGRYCEICDIILEHEITSAIKNDYNTLTAYRNSMNHAGFTANRDYDQIMRQLPIIFSIVKTAINNWQNK